MSKQQLVSNEDFSKSVLQPDLEYSDCFTKEMKLKKTSDLTQHDLTQAGSPTKEAASTYFENQDGDKEIEPCSGSDQN